MKQLWQGYPRHVVLLSAVQRETWSGEQDLCFKNGKGTKGRYIKTQAVFPSAKSAGNSEPELLPRDPNAILKLALELETEQPVLFYAKLSIYSKCKAWPNEDDIIQVAAMIEEDSTKFLADLKVASSGFYFIDADDPISHQLLRGTDFRSSYPKGIALMLACTFPSHSDYMQGRARVKRATDEGTVYELQQ